MGARFLSWWQKIKQHPVAAVLTALLVVVIVLVVLSVLGYIFNWNWTGLGPYIPPTKASNFQRGKTLWDWLQLLIIPAVLAVGGYLFNYTTSKNEQEATKQRTQSEHEAAEKRAQTERDIALDNQREAALQAYIDKMSELLLKEHLSELKPEDEGVRKIARVRTLTVLPRLDAKRKGSVLQFLYESGLIDRDKSIVDLYGADLVEVHLEGADLERAELHEAHLREAKLGWSHLEGADLNGADLNGADLSGADLGRANLGGADLGRADLGRANLEEADLGRADLHEANLHEANLEGAYLEGAYLMWAKVTQEQLEKAESLEGATMPDGSIHP